MAQEKIKINSSLTLIRASDFLLPLQLQEVA
ncbi:UNVERIFIED_CONTAM: hypothetical protein BJ887_4195 [Enterobacter sp. WPR_3_1]